jgi:hypothetical protein
MATQGLQPATVWRAARGEGCEGMRREARGDEATGSERREGLKVAGCAQEDNPERRVGAGARAGNSARPTKQHKRCYVVLRSKVSEERLAMCISPCFNHVTMRLCAGLSDPTYARGHGMDLADLSKLSSADALELVARLHQANEQLQGSAVGASHRAVPRGAAFV